MKLDLKESGQDWLCWFSPAWVDQESHQRPPLGNKKKSVVAYFEVKSHSWKETDSTEQSPRWEAGGATNYAVKKFPDSHEHESSSPRSQHAAD